MTSRLHRPRAKTETARCGACGVAARARAPAGLDGGEAEAAVRVGRHAAEAAEGGLERAFLRVLGVRVASRARWPARARAARRARAGRRRRARGRSTVTRSPGDAGRRQIARVSQARPIEKNGPTVCEGVARGRGSALHRRRLAAAQHDVEAVAERLLRHRRVPVERGDQAAARALSSAVQLKIGSAASSGSPGKYICVTRRVAKAGPKTEKWMCAGPPGVVVVAPGIGAGADGDEAVAALVVGQGAAAAGEVRVERRVVLVDRVADSGRRRWPARPRPACAGTGRPSSSSTRPLTTMRSPSGWARAGA